MSLVREVVDAIEIIANSIENMQKIAEAIRKGVGLVKAKYPETKKNLIVMSQEITSTLDALAVASSIVTRFAFTVSGSNVDDEPRVFNDYFRANVTDENEVRQQLETLRGHCHIIKEHAEAMSKAASKRGLRSLFGLLGVDSRKQEAELGERLEQIYEEDMALYATVDKMSAAVNGAMEHIQRTLGPHGKMQPKNVPAAAELLGQYSLRFSDLQSRCVSVAGDLKLMIREVSDN